MSLNALTLLQASSGDWVSVSLRSRRSLPPRLWVPSPCFTPYDPFTALGPLGFVMPVSLCPPTPLSLSPYNRTCPDTLLTNGRVFSWSSCCSPSPRRFPLASNPSTSYPLSGPCSVSPPPLRMPCSYSFAPSPKSAYSSGPVGRSSPAPRARARP